jgi:hypothetical protein
MKSLGAAVEALAGAVLAATIFVTNGPVNINLAALILKVQKNISDWNKLIHWTLLHFCTAENTQRII